MSAGLMKIIASWISHVHLRVAMALELSITASVPGVAHYRRERENIFQWKEDAGSAEIPRSLTRLNVSCSPSAPLRLIEGLHEGRISGSS
jgi:hypothetical protein